MISKRAYIPRKMAHNQISQESNPPLITPKIKRQQHAVSTSYDHYDSICLAKKPAAVSTAFCSTSPNEASLE